jgi:hypothetical protein
MQLVTGLDRFSFYLSWAFVSHGQKDSPPSSSFIHATGLPRSHEPTLRLCVVSAQGCSHVPSLTACYWVWAQVALQAGPYMQVNQPPVKQVAHTCINSYMGLKSGK